MNRLQIHTGDITRLAVGAIVNAANERLLGGGGVDGAIHAAAGPQLLEACRAIAEVEPGVRCPPGEARITPGFDLPARYVIHTVGPRWRGGTHGEPQTLASCYRTSLALAVAHAVDIIAFPAISTGVFGYPLREAGEIAIAECAAFLAAEPRMQRIVLVAFKQSDAAVLENILRTSASRS